MTPEVFLWFTTLLFILLGLTFGSFGTTIVFRVPMQKGMGGRSRCSVCLKKLSIRELIPVLSFLVQRGVCRQCKMSIHWLYPFTEVATVFLFVLALWIVPYSLILTLVLALLLWLLLLIAIIDVKTQTVPDVLSIPFVTGAILYAVGSGQFDHLAMILGAGVFAAQWILSRGMWVGSGDIILGAGVGALLGHWTAVIHWLVASYVLGSIVVSILLVTGKKTRKDRIAFAPFLVVGLLVVMIFEKII